MMNKRLFALFLVAVMVIVTMTGCSSKPADLSQSDSTNNSNSSSGSASSGDGYGEYNLKLSTVLSETSSWYALGKKIADDMDAATNGKVKITVYPNEQLSGGNQTKGLELIMNGSTDMDLRSAMLWAVVDDRLGAISLPFFYDNLEDVDKQLAGPGGEAYKTAMSDSGIHWLGFAEGGWRQLYSSTKAVTKLEDMKGMKFRLASVPMNMATFKALGSNPVVMNWSEMFTGLQQGTVDGLECPLTAALESSVNEVCKSITMWDYSYDCGLLSMNQKLWDSFPEELQDIFTEVVSKNVAAQVQSERKHNDEAMLEFRDKYGVAINYLTDEEKAKFKEAASSVVSDYEKEVGKEYVDLFRQGK